MKLFSFIAVSFFFITTTQAQSVTTTDYRKIPSVVAESFDQKNACAFAFSQAERPYSITKTEGIYTFIYKKYNAKVTNITEGDYEKYQKLRKEKDEELEQQVSKKKEEE